MRAVPWPTLRVAVDVQLEVMFELYRQGASLREAVEPFGMSAEWLRLQMIEAGIPRRSAAERARAREDAAVESYLRLRDLGAVAAEHGFTVNDLRRRLRRRLPTGQVPQTRPRDHRVPAGYWSKVRIIEAIRMWTDTYGRPPVATDWNPAAARRLGHPEKAERFQQGLWPYAVTVVTRCGGWTRAILAAQEVQSDAPPAAALYGETQTA